MATRTRLTAARAAAGLTATLIATALPPRASTTLRHDDGVYRGVTDLPAEVVQRKVDVKEMAVFAIRGPARVRKVRILFGGRPGLATIHLWKDIGSAFHPYLPFRHFEYDHCPPIAVTVRDRDLGKWRTLDLRALGSNLTLEHGQKLAVGMFAQANGPRFGCDRHVDHPGSSVIELHDPKDPGQQPIRLYNASGDYMVRLVVDRLREPRRLFRDVTAAMGLEGVRGNAFAWADVNGDGWEDLLVGGRRLFLNDRGRRFHEVTAACGLQGVKADFGLFADVDNDGDLDLFCGATRRDLADSLWLNDGKGHFRRTTVDAPGDRFMTYAASWLDYDCDGKVDLFVANGGELKPDAPYDPNGLWRNLGGGRFVDVTHTLGIERPDGSTTRFSRAATSADLDGDGRPELLVGTYWLQPDRLWRFAGGRATDIAPALGVAGGPTPLGKPGNGSALGANIVDLDADGRLDIFVANLMHPDWRGYLASNESWLFRRVPGRKLAFRRVPASAIGIDYQETPSDPTFGDFNNDGGIDLFENSWYHTGRFYLQRHGHFRDRTLASGIVARQATASAACDFDRDGRLDLVVADALRGLRLYRNVGPRGRWLEVRLHGTHSNRAAIGAVVRACAGSRIVTRVVTSGKGMGNQDSLTLHFGLPPGTAVRRLEITWPGGHKQVVRRPALRRLLDVCESPVLDGVACHAAVTLP